ncbi:hypothetical protein RRG08_043362 [Elysia crispata]|uniref:Uncharacterized protein n=1 Tax=Elysia crispata TaxID=231223 RepID=A0AAE0Z5M6_9GAST|nr:hypothetical protein RRG08_043362 [Elysia crispata]
MSARHQLTSFRKRQSIRTDEMISSQHHRVASGSQFVFFLIPASCCPSEHQARRYFQSFVLHLIIGNWFQMDVWADVPRWHRNKGAKCIRQNGFPIQS